MVRPRSQSDLIADPGAYASTQVPQFEYDAFASVFSEAATVNTPLAPAGDAVDAAAASFPAAPARETPRVPKFLTPALCGRQLPPPPGMVVTSRARSVRVVP